MLRLGQKLQRRYKVVLKLFHKSINFLLKSFDISNAIFENWMNIKRSDRSSILIIMMRSQTILELKAGVFKVSLDRFTDVRKISNLNLDSHDNVFLF